MDAISNQQLIEVIADFLEMGHVDNIVAMFRQDPSCLPLSGELIQDERFMVRMGMAVLFEELAAVMPAGTLTAAVPSLAPLTSHPAPYVRGDAAHLLATIGDASALQALAAFRVDPDPQVAAIADEALAARP